MPVKFILDTPPACDVTWAGGAQWSVTCWRQTLETSARLACSCFQQLPDWLSQQTLEVTAPESSCELYTMGAKLETAQRIPPLCLWRYHNGRSVSDGHDPSYEITQANDKERQPRLQAMFAHAHNRADLSHLLAPNLGGNVLKKSWIMEWGQY